MRYLIIFFVFISFNMNAQNAKVLFVYGEVFGNKKLLQVGDDLTPKINLKSHADSTFIILLHSDYTTSELEGKFDTQIKKLVQKSNKQEVTSTRKQYLDNLLHFFSSGNKPPNHRYRLGEPSLVELIDCGMSKVFNVNHVPVYWCVRDFGFRDRKIKYFELCITDMEDDRLEKQIIYAQDTVIDLQPYFEKLDVEQLLISVLAILDEGMYQEMNFPSHQICEYQSTKY